MRLKDEDGKLRRKLGKWFLNRSWEELEERVAELVSGGSGSPVTTSERVEKSTEEWKKSGGGRGTKRRSLWGTDEIF